MIGVSNKTNAIPAAMLLAAAMLPVSPLWTISAYGDTETSSANIFQAGMWGEVVEIEQFSLLLDEPGEAVFESGEVAGTSTEPVVEVSDPVVETTIDDSAADPVEDPAPEAPAVEVGEPVVEVTTPEVVEEETTPEPEPPADPQPEPTPTEESTS
jgi:hypothetical protein